jgi:hypothetical protein
VIFDHGPYKIIVQPDGRMFAAKAVPAAKLTTITRGTFVIPEFSSFDVVASNSRVTPAAAVNATRHALNQRMQPQ